MPCEKCEEEARQKAIAEGGNPDDPAFSGSAENSGIESTNPLIILLVPVAIASTFVLGVCLTAAFAIIVVKCRKPALIKLRKLKEKMMWNGAIRSVSIGYLNLCIAGQVKLIELRKAPGEATAASWCTAVGFTIFLVGYFAGPLAYMAKHREVLDTPEVRARIGNWYAGIKVSGDGEGGNRWAFLFYPFFILKRLLFVMLPFIFMGLEAQQLQCLLLCDIFYLIFYLKLNPHIERTMRRMELVNECLQLVVYYHMVLFSSFDTNAAAKFEFGYSFLVCLMCIMLVNVGVAAYESVVSARRKSRRAKAKEAYEARVEEAKAAEAEAKARSLAVGLAKDRALRRSLFAKALKNQAEAEQVAKAK